MIEVRKDTIQGEGENIKKKDEKEELKRRGRKERKDTI